jgi:hypothetical protein
LVVVVVVVVGILGCNTSALLQAVPLPRGLGLLPSCCRLRLLRLKCVLRALLLKRNGRASK